MINIDATFYVQLINFIIALIVFNYLLVKPIREIIKKRAGVMGDLLTETEKFSEAAEAKMKNYEEALAEARKAGAEERVARKDEAVAEEKKILDAAMAEAQQTMKAARSEIADQTKTAMDSLKGQVESLADKAAAQILK